MWDEVESKADVDEILSRNPIDSQEKYEKAMTDLAKLKEVIAQGVEATNEAKQLHEQQVSNRAVACFVTCCSAPGLACLRICKVIHNCSDRLCCYSAEYRRDLKHLEQQQVLLNGIVTHIEDSIAKVYIYR